MSLRALITQWRERAEECEREGRRRRLDDAGIAKGMEMLRDAAQYRQCAQQLESALAGGGEAVAWMHTRHMELGQTITLFSQSQENPFGEPGVDYSAEYTMTSVPLFTKGETL